MQLTHEDLFSLEDYSRKRDEFRKKIMAHKRNRHVEIGPVATLYFEDRKTMQYQIQEMLRIERIFEAEAIQEELDTYNPLIPDGSNWKATFMIEIADIDERKKQLAQMIGIEKALWVRVDGFDKVTPIANEDLTRETEEKTSSVHFVRFELSAAMIGAAKSGATIAMGIDHPAYQHEVAAIPQPIASSLVADLT